MGGIQWKASELQIEVHAEFNHLVEIPKHTVVSARTQNYVYEIHFYLKQENKIIRFLIAVCRVYFGLNPLDQRVLC